MRVAILNITFGDISGGYRAYLEELVPRLAISDQVSAILIGLPEGIELPCLQKNYLSIERLKLKVSRFSLSGINSKTKKYIQQFAPDVIYIPVARYLNLNDIPVVNMNQNMEPYVASIRHNPLSEKIRLFLLKKAGRFAFRKAQKVIAISDFVKNALVNDLQVPEEKIAVIYHGYSKLTNKTSFIKPSLITSNMVNNFIFTAGSIRPARGLEDILKALNYLKLKKINQNLVIAGGTVANMRIYRECLENYILKNNLSDNVLWAEKLTPEEMNFCYKNCKLFVMTSRVEACSVTALESMAHGCITMSSENPPLPEIYGKAALFYPPHDYKTLAKHIMSAQSFSMDEIISIRKKSIDRSAQFNWDKCISTTIDQLVEATGLK